ncbi:MAG TPA: enolase C-terminal domain-like protein, partial [Dehalococcoidia bacterium]|nr:enolase C-terminal domain-like protein [Dehalococcoidia bacterium]
MTTAAPQVSQLHVPIEDMDIATYTIPTDKPEADGTLAWDSTSMVLVTLKARGQRGIGFSYCSTAAATVIEQHLASLVQAMTVDADIWSQMLAAVRNIGRAGVAANAISAVDIALWDLRAHLAGLPLCEMLNHRRLAVPVYGSGGFTSYSELELEEQLHGWVEAGIPRVKMKIGKDWGESADEDVRRVQTARRAIGPNAELFVDANGAYTPKQALQQAQRFAEAGVSYFEEPVSSDHLEELAFVREQAPMSIAAGEYGYSPFYFKNMLAAKAVDILQADATRCLGITGFLQAGAMAYAAGVPFSAHTAPSIHAHP